MSRYADQIRAFKKPALLTFTVPNARRPEELPAALESLTKGFERLRRHAAWPKAARGVWSLEITWSAETGFHPHLHCLVDLPWIDLDWISAAWEGLTGAKHRPDVTRPKTPQELERLPLEGMKYITKAWELDDDALRSILAVLGRRRMFNPFGGLRAAQEEDEASGACCPGCGTPLALCGFNFSRTVLEREEAEARALELRGSGYGVFHDWYYPDQLPPIAPPPGRVDARAGAVFERRL